MAIELVAAPEEEPITLEQAKLHVKQDIDDDDELMMPLISGARQACENYTNRAFVTQSWRLTLDYDWPIDREIVLPVAPVASVSSVSYVDLLGATQTLASDQYTLAKLQTGRSAIVPAYDIIWPDVRSVPAAVTIDVVAGVAVGALPSPITSAILLLIGHLYTNREPVNIGNIVNLMPLSVQWLLDPYVIHPCS